MPLPSRALRAKPGVPSPVTRLSVLAKPHHATVVTCPPPTDTGLQRGDKDVMQSLWEALDTAGYRDTLKAKTVDYMDAKRGDYTGLY